MKLVKCGHMFCKGCIDKWSKIKKECPVCKRKSVKYQVVKFKQKSKKGLMEVEGDWSDDDRPIPTGGFELEIVGRGVGGGVVEYANDGGTPKWTWDTHNNDDEEDEEEEIEEIFRTKRGGSSAKKSTTKTPLAVKSKDDAKKSGKKGMRSFSDLDNSSDSEGGGPLTTTPRRHTSTPRRHTSTARRPVPRRATPMFKTPGGGRPVNEGGGGYVGAAIKAWKSDLWCRREGREESRVIKMIQEGGKHSRQTFLQCCAMWLTPTDGQVPAGVKGVILNEVKIMNCRREELRGTGGLGKIVLWHASKGDECARGIIEGWCDEVGGRGGGK